VSTGLEDQAVLDFPIGKFPLDLAADGERAQDLRIRPDCDTDLPYSGPIRITLLGCYGTLNVAIFIRWSDTGCISSRLADSHRSFSSAAPFRSVIATRFLLLPRGLIPSRPSF